MVETSNEYITWSDIRPPLEPSLLKVLTEDMKFPKVTKTQMAVIPLLTSNKDVCVKACTGSGKTLAFVVPIVQTLLKLL